MRDGSSSRRNALANLSNIVMGAAVLSGKTVAKFVPKTGAQLALVGTNALTGALHDDRQKAAARIISRFRNDAAAKWEQWVPDDAFGNEQRRAHAIASFDEVLPKIQLSAAEVAGQRMNADLIADLMVRKAEQLMPQVYSGHDPYDADADLARRFLRDICASSYNYIIELPEFSAQLAPAIWKDLQGQIDQLDARLEQGLTEQDQRLKALESLLVSSLQASGQEDSARAQGVSETALLRLASRIAGDVTNPTQAIRELEFAVDLAMSVQQAPEAKGAPLDPVLGRVSDLSAQGQFGEAADTIEQALARETAAHQARTTTLLEAAVQQDILRRDAPAAANHLIRLSDTKAGGHATFGVLTTLYMDWFVKARDRGLLIDLLIGEELARAMLTRADGAAEKGRALNFLGVMCHLRGERISGASALLAAVAAFEEAQIYWGRAQFPADWAKAQMNLANSQHALAQRDPGNERLDRAIAAYEIALGARDRQEEPEAWAQTAMNMCTALRTQAEGARDVQLATRARDLALDALSIRTREANPDAWATTQLNLGMCTRVIGHLSRARDQLDEAQDQIARAAAHWKNDPGSYLGAICEQQSGLCALAQFDLSPHARHLTRAIDHFDTALLHLNEENSAVDMLMTQGHQFIAQSQLARSQADSAAQMSAEIQLQEVTNRLANDGHIRGAQVLTDLQDRLFTLSLADTAPEPQQT